MNNEVSDKELTTVGEIDRVFAGVSGKDEGCLF